MKAPSLYFQTIPWQPHQIWSYGPWRLCQPYFRDLVRVGEIMLAYLPNPTSYGHDTYTTGYSHDWGLKWCVEILWQPHQIWSYEPVKSAIFMDLVRVGRFSDLGGLLKTIITHVSKDKPFMWTHFGTVSPKICFLKPSDICMAILLHGNCITLITLWILPEEVTGE